jgi:hypothetical protein
MVGLGGYEGDPTRNIIQSLLAGLGQGTNRAVKGLQLPGDILKGALAPVMGPAGHLLDLPGTNNNTSLFPRPNYSPERVAEALAAWEKIKAGGVTTAFSPDTFREGMSDQAFPGKLAAEFGTDPMSYVGLGIPGKAAMGIRAAPTAGKYALRLARALEYSQYVDNAVAESPMALAKGTLGGAKAVLQHIPTGGVFHVYGENQVPREAKNLYDWMTSTSRQGWYKQVARKVANTANTLREGGRKLQVDIVNEQMLQQERDRAAEATRTRNYRSYEEDLQPHLNQLLGNLRENVARTSDPAEKAWKFELMRAIEQAHQDVWSEAWAQLQHIKALKQYTSKETGKKITMYSDPDWYRISEVVQDAYYKSLALTTSGLAHMEHMAPDAVSNLRLNVIPGSAEDAARSAIDKAMMSVDRIVQTGGRRNKLAGPQGSNFNPGGPSARNYLLRNQQTNAAYQAGSDELGKLFGESYKPVLGYPRERTAQILQEAQDVREGRPIIHSYLPNELQRFVGREWHNFGKHASELAGDRDTILKTLRTAWEENPVTKTSPFPIQERAISTGNPDDRWPAINAVLKKMSLPEVDPVKGGIPALRHSLAETMVAHPDIGKRWDTVIQRWKEGDPISADPYEVVVDRILRAKAHEYGVDTPKGSIKDILQTGTGLWKETNLLSPTYPITNLMGGLVASHIAGVSPKVILMHLGNNINKLRTGEPILISDLSNHLSSLKMRLPSGIAQSSGTMMGETPQKSYLGENLTSSARLGPLWTSAIGATVGGAAGALQSNVDNRPEAVAHGVLTGAIGGAALPFASRILLRNIGGGLEQVMRQAVFDKVLTERLVGPGGGIDATVEQATRMASANTKSVTQINPISGQRTAVTLPSSSATPDHLVSELTKTFSSRGGFPSVDEVNQTLIRSGLDPEQAAMVGQVWNNRIYSAMQDGMKAVNTVHVDYEVLNNAEQFARTAMPFSTWSTRMFPFFGKYIMENPQLLMSLVALNKLSQDDIKRKGLTSRFTGSVHLGLGDAYFSAILGHPVQNFYNPLAGLLPFSSAERSLDRASSALEQGQIIPAATSALGAVGLGIHPIPEAMIRMLDPSGDMPAQGYVRQAAPLQGAEALIGLNKGQGYDLNAGFTQIESKAREFLHGQAPTDLKQAGILRRIDELALRNTGEPISSGSAKTAPYIAAKASQSGPIYDQAASEVSKEGGLKSLFGYFAQVLAPQAILNQQEAQIRGSQVEHRAADEAAGITPVRNEIKTLIDAGKGNDPAPGEMVRGVHALVNPAEYDKNGADQIRRLYDVGTVAAMKKLLDGAYPYPEDAAAGYQSGGSPLETELGNQMNVYQNPAAIAAMQGQDPTQVAAQWASYQNADPALRQAMESNKYSGVQAAYNLKDQYKAGSPLLNAYLGWQQQQGHSGRQNEFINDLLRQRSLAGRASSVGK